MALQRIYRLTEAGSEAWESQDPDLPIEYQRILGAVGEGADLKVIRTSLTSYPENELLEWLATAEELGLIECLPASPRLGLQR